MRRSILLALAASAALTLTACASGGPRTMAPTLAPPAARMAPCPPLPQPASGSLTDLLANHVAVAKVYHQCRDRHQGLIDWLKVTEKESM